MSEIKVFWRILFDVVPTRTFLRTKFTIDLRKEYTVWDVDHMVRLANGVVELPWKIRGRVRIYDGVVKFNSGYLECTDLAVDYSRWIREEDKVSGANQGENVSVAVEVSLPRRDAKSPLFYYPQDTTGNYLMLSVFEERVARAIKWKIEQEGCQTVGSYQSHGRDGWHRVRVRQDQDWRAPSLNYFEFLVDNVPLPPRRYRRQIQQPKGEFAFTNEDKVFYIGRVPDPDHNCNTHSRQPSHWIDLTGDLRHLVFDPNDSCSSCGG